MRAVLAMAGLALGCQAAAPPAAVTPQPAAAPRIAVERRDAVISSEPGVAIALREVIVPGRDAGVPVLLVHGAGGGGISSFDLAVPGYSLAEDLARAGHPTYVIDVRGWGSSSRPPALDQPADANPPAVGSEDAVTDIAAAVTWIHKRRDRTVAIVGWATGGHWAGMCAATHPSAVSHLVMLNALYGTPGEWSLRKQLEDPAHPGELGRLGAYTARSAAGLLQKWDANIPVDDKASWRDPRVAEAYAGTAIASDPTSAQRTPPSVRVPTGPLSDSFALAGGTRLWDAANVRAAVLVVRSELDFWSRPEDVAALQRELIHARRAEFVTLPRATHVVFLDRPEHGRAELVARLLEFLARD